MTGFFDTRKGEILMSMILELKFPKKILTFFSKWRIITMRQLETLCFSKVHIIKFRTSGYNQGRIISIIAFTENRWFFM